MSAKKESLGKTVGVVVAVCLVCSIVVSGAAVGLRSLQQTNAQLDKQTNILTAAGLYETGMSNDTINAKFDEFVDQHSLHKMNKNSLLLGCHNLLFQLEHHR